MENIITVNGHRMANNAAIEIAADQTKEAHPEVFLATTDLVLFGVHIYRGMRESDPRPGPTAANSRRRSSYSNTPELVKESEFVGSSDGGWTQFTSNDFVNLNDKILSAKSSHDWSEDALGH